MQSHPGPRLPLAIRVGHAINRLSTWGMTSAERQRLLSEGLADWEAMAADRRPVQILGRAMRGIPAAIWVRLSDHEVTAMPAGIALSMVGMGGMASGLWGSPYPAPFRQFVVLACLGLLLLGLNFVRDARRLVLPRYRPAMACIIVGFAGLGLTLPTAAQWPYEGPVLEHIVMDRALQVSFGMISTGFLLLILASFRTTAPRLLSAAVFLLVAGTTILGVTQVAWGVTMAPVDLAMTAASIVIGLGALSFTHVLPRLRHLDVVYSHAETNRLDQQSLRKGAS